MNKIMDFNHKLARLEVEQMIAEFFERSTEEQKLRLFENLMFQVSFEVLSKMYESEKINSGGR